MTVDRLITVNGVFAEPDFDYDIKDGLVRFRPDFGIKPTDRVNAITPVTDRVNTTTICTGFRITKLAHSDEGWRPE